MEGTPLYVLGLAVFGSVGSCLVLGVYMFVQAYVDTSRRKPYFAFSLLWWALALCDALFLGAWLSQELYEQIRIFWCGSYVGLLFWLFGYRHFVSILSGLTTTLCGMYVWVSLPEMATTITFPVAFLLTGIAHMRMFFEDRGYASCVLAAYAMALALSCAGYYLHVSQALISGEQKITLLGYGNYALLSVLAVVFGWVNLPREMRGMLPVRVSFRAAAYFFGVVVLSQFMVVVSVAFFYSWPPVTYALATLVIIIAQLVLHFYHRHQIVIYTANVSELLEKRTQSLRKAQEELAQLNSQQARQLKVQSSELDAQSQVIERQRRLEMAAQTTGQVSHDIQNLISPIVSQVQQLQNAGGDSEIVSRSAQKISRQVDQLLELNSQMLALSRRGRLDMQPLNLSDLLQDLRERFDDAPLVMKLDQAVWVKGAWSQLSRAFANVISNALESGAPAHAPVYVTCEWEDLRQARRAVFGRREAGRYARVSVTDSGEGIPDELLSSIFEPFYSTKTGTDVSGSGLGLSIVSAIVDDHHGHIDIDSSAEGTIFSVFLPAVKAPGKDVTPHELSGDETIVVADDDTVVLQQYGKLLASNGYHVILAKNGKEAVHALHKEHVDVMVLDLNLPDLSGYETYFAAIHQQQRLKAIVHAAYISHAHEVQLGLLGVQTFLLKPSSPQEFLQAIRHECDR